MAPAAFFRLLTLLVSVLLTDAARAQDLPAPTGPVLLTFSGEVPVTNGDGVARFDRQMLLDMPATSFATRTAWTNGEQQFTGVLLKTLLDRLGIASGNLAATAVNDYAVTIPVSDATDPGPIIAYMHNGQPMSLRDKGPLWVIYPYDSSYRFQTEVIYSRSIWQLDRIVVTR